MKIMLKDVRKEFNNDGVTGTTSELASLPTNLEELLSYTLMSDQENEDVEGGGSPQIFLDKVANQRINSRRWVFHFCSICAAGP